MQVYWLSAVDTLVAIQTAHLPSTCTLRSDITDTTLITVQFPSTWNHLAISISLKLPGLMILLRSHLSIENIWLEVTTSPLT